MPNLSHTPKEIKRGWLKGKKEKLKMYSDILFTLVQLYLIPKWLKGYTNTIYNTYFKV